MSYHAVFYCLRADLVDELPCVDQSESITNGVVLSTEISVWNRLATTQKPIRSAEQPLTIRDAIRTVVKLRRLSWP